MQRIRNYGSFLQAYGLRRILESLGCEVRFVDYRLGPCLVGSESSSRLSRPAAKLAEVVLGQTGVCQLQVLLRPEGVASIRSICRVDYRTEILEILVIVLDGAFNFVQSNPNVGYSPDLFGAGSKAGRLVTYAESFGNATAEISRLFTIWTFLPRKLSRSSCSCSSMSPRRRQPHQSSFGWLRISHEYFFD